MISEGRETALHLARASEGDQRSLGWVIQRFSPFVETQVRHRLRGFGSASDVEDLVAEVWIVVLRRFSDLETREGKRAHVLLGFLGTTALQVCNNHLRRLARAPQATPTLDAEPDGRTRGMLTSLARRDLADQIRASLEQLPETARAVLALRLLEQLSNHEIALELGIPANTVAVRYRRALERLRRSLPRDAFGEVWHARARPMTGSA